MTEQEIRADERSECARKLRLYAKGLMDHAISLITAGDDANGLPKISRAAAIDSAADLLERMQ